MTALTVPVGRVARAAWRRNRMTLAAIAATFAAFAVVMFSEAITMRSTVNAHHLWRCMNLSGAIPSVCYSNQAWVSLLDRNFYYVIWIEYGLLFLPVVVAVLGGVRWLTREYDTGVYRYTWTQSVSRTRWATGTALPLLGTVVAASALCGWAFAWWIQTAGAFPPQTNGGTWGSLSFPLVPLCYVSLSLALFAVAALVGATIRKTIPALVVALIGCVVVTVAADVWLRPWLLGLDAMVYRSASPASFSGGPPGSFFLNAWFTNARGHVFPQDVVWSAAPQSSSLAVQNRWFAIHHYSYWVSYQPLSRLGLFQAAWSGILLAGALAAFALAGWQVRARRG